MLQSCLNLKIENTNVFNQKMIVIRTNTVFLVTIICVKLTSKDNYFFGIE